MDYKKMCAEAQAEADSIGEITDEVRKQWFIDFGTQNLWDEETSKRYMVATLLHQRDKHEHPELHGEAPWKRHWSCWHEDNCKCGFCVSWDSSD